MEKPFRQSCCFQLLAKEGHMRVPSRITPPDAGFPALDSEKAFTGFRKIPHLTFPAGGTAAAQPESAVRG